MPAAPQYRALPTPLHQQPDRQPQWNIISACIRAKDSRQGIVGSGELGILIECSVFK
jgi:hypothetical protein